MLKTSIPSDAERKAALIQKFDEIAPSLPARKPATANIESAEPALLGFTGEPKRFLQPPDYIIGT